MAVVGQVHRIAAALRTSVEQIYDEAGVTATEVELLVPLRYPTDGLSAIRLAELLGMTRAGVAKALASLEGRGLVARRPNPADRRSAVIDLTDAGQALIDEVFPRELKVHADMLANLGGDRESVSRSLRHLADAVAPPE
ncbi:MarR family winged helix-turn-helix transcriptional regulator [Rhodococcus sp. W8901]|uniref:MarR family winged helix-turn-helix transcriptional regulator n=1 Tax=Rhodococcus sp. W8901 TaxID=2742603 RepID=UPI0020C68CE8|nr:MarR family transcriptional regulator [Rhodococcus sp. W8901]